MKFLVWLVCLGALPAYALDNRQSRPDRQVSRVAFGSCAFQWVEQPILRAVVAAAPDLYLSLGDAIYGDFDGKATFDVTPESLRGEWRKLGDNPDWQRLVSEVPIVDGTWDNHDYGHHSAGAEFPLKEKSKEIFLDFFGEPADSARRERPGIFDASIHGPEGRRVQIVLLDTRTFKSPPVLAERPEGAGGSLGKYAPNEDPEATLLGEAQWSWLEKQLGQPAEVRLIASSGQIVADEKGMDEWGNYPLERRRFFDLIAKTGANGVVLLSGNVHFAEISATDEGPYRLFDFTSSGLTHVNQEYPKARNRHRVAGPFVDLNFGLVEIDWEAEGGPVLTMAAIDVEGRAAFELSVPLASLSAPVDSPAAQERDGQPATDAATPSASDLAAELSNPNTSVASLTFKLQYRRFEGDLPKADDQSGTMLLFQPSLPFVLDSGDKILWRPAVPVFMDQPVFDANRGKFDGEAGLGDIAFDLAYAPKTGAGSLFAFGLITSLPTATNDLGTDRWTLGPEVLIGKMTSKYVVGLFPNHQWDVGGPGKADVNLTTIQAFYTYLPGGGWNVGSGPIMSYDWESKQWTLPLQVNAGKTVVFGGRAWKLSVELNYYVDKPDAFGPEWMIGFNIAPVVKNRMAGWFGLGGE